MTQAEQLIKKMGRNNRRGFLKGLEAAELPTDFTSRNVMDDSSVLFWDSAKKRWDHKAPVMA